ncbi:MAG TPA: CHAT domain-containing protein [Kofleriaceae bacterium]
MNKHRILFLAANPSKSSGVSLDQECAAIERELRMTTHRDDFDFRSKWAVTVDEMMRHLGELQPTIIHFSGHGANPAGSPVNPTGKSGIFLLDDRGGPQLVTTRALMMMIKSASASTRIVLLNACYSEPQADAVRSVVDCVVGMAGAIDDDAARSFAVGFYRALGNRRSVGNAVDQAVATLAAKGMPDEKLPRCLTRDGVDAYKVTLDPS